MFQVQIDICMTEPAEGIFAGRMVAGFGPEHRRTLDSAKFHRQRVLAFAIEADLGKDFADSYFTEWSEEGIVA